MSDFPPKAHNNVDQPFAFREGKANYHVDISRWAEGGFIPDGGVTIDWPLTVIVLEDADKSDPANMLRVYGVRVGETLAYRVVFTDAAEVSMGKDWGRFLLALMLKIGVERADEIKAAIAAEREGAAAAA